MQRHNFTEKKRREAEKRGKEKGETEKKRKMHHPNNTSN